MKSFFCFLRSKLYPLKRLPLFLCILQQTKGEGHHNDVQCKMQLPIGMPFMRSNFCKMKCSFIINTKYKVHISIWIKLNFPKLLKFIFNCQTLQRNQKFQKCLENKLKYYCILHYGIKCYLWMNVRWITSMIYHKY